MITLNYRDARPIYEQVCDGLRRLIVSGAIADGDKLPSVRALATQLAINPNTSAPTTSWNRAATAAPCPARAALPCTPTARRTTRAAYRLSSRSESFCRSCAPWA